MNANALKIFGRTSKVHEAVFIHVKNESNAGYADRCVSIANDALHGHGYALRFMQVASTSCGCTLTVLVSFT